MSRVLDRGRTSTTAAILVSGGIGIAVVTLYLIAGFLLTDWSLTEFTRRLSPAVLGHFVVFAALVVAVLGIPLLLFLRFNLIAPVVIFIFVVLIWTGIGSARGLLSMQTIFGFGLYAAVFSPLYLILYGILGGAEYWLRAKSEGG